MQVDEIIVCVRLSVEIDEYTLSDDAWLYGAVYSSAYKNGVPNIRIYTDGITIGKEYRISRLNRNTVTDTINVINDQGGERSYLRELFETKSEWRQKKLEEIGI
jgi:hypothetical protein